MNLFAQVAQLLAGRAFRVAALAASAALMLLSLWQEQREDSQFEQLVVSTFHTPEAAHGVITSQANAVLLLHHVHEVVSENSAKKTAEHGMNEQLFWAPGDHLTHPHGVCTSYSTVLAKALQMAGFPVRKVGLSHEGTKAVHHVVETLADGHWMLLDAAFDLVFNRPGGGRASAREVAANWPYYRRQTPANYPSAYDYDGYYYTNWDRVPGAWLAFKVWPTLRRWVDDHDVSLRFVFLNIWNWLAVFWGCMTGCLMLSYIRRSCYGSRKIRPVVGSLASEPLTSPLTSRRL